MAITKGKKVFLGELLVRDRLITGENLNKALDLQRKKGGLIGMILVNQGLITEENLMRYIRIQEEENKKAGLGPDQMKRKRLGEMLVENNEITKAQLDKALEYQKKTGAKLGIALIDKGYIDKSTLVSYVARQSQTLIDSIGISTVEAKHMVSEAEKK